MFPRPMHAICISPPPLVEFYCRVRSRGLQKNGQGRRLNHRRRLRLVSAVTQELTSLRPGPGLTADRTIPDLVARGKPGRGVTFRLPGRRSRCPALTGGMPQAWVRYRQVSRRSVNIWSGR